MDDDGALVQRCLLGDAEAIRAFVERFQGMMYSLSFRMLGHRHDAEDVTQESLLRALRHLGGWEQKRPLRPWLLAITANRCRTRLSRRKVQPQPAAVEFAAPAVTGKDHSLSEEIQRAVDELREDQRACFVLFYQQELSIQEVAAALDCPEGTVKTWLYRARRQIAERLRQRGVVTEAGHELQSG